MERVTDNKQSVWTNLMEQYQLAYQHAKFQIFPQMPARQIHYFIKQAARNERQVTVQLNHYTHVEDVSEVTGQLSLSPHSSHIILTPTQQNTIHLIQPNVIRHIRLVENI